MPNSNLVEVVCVIDRSGSMGHLKVEAENGFNSFIKKMKKDLKDKELRLTLVQFDDVIEIVYENTPFKKVKKYIMEPRNMTALLDAMGTTINKVGERLSNEKDEDRPGRIIFMTVTDGQENASKDFTREKVKEMIEHQETKYAWDFLFLSSDLNSFKDSQKFNYGGITGQSFSFSSADGIKGLSGYSGCTGYQGVYGVVAENLTRSVLTKSKFTIENKEE